MVVSITINSKFIAIYEVPERVNPKLYTATDIFRPFFFILFCSYSPFLSLGKLNHERNLNKLNLKLKIVAALHNPSTREDDTGDH